MTLDNNTKQFSDAIRAASEHLNIAAIYIEKDYWITKILQQLSKTPQASNIVWKGGTSLSKGYRLIDRFSSDIDVAVVIPELHDDWFSVVPRLWGATRSVSTLIEPVLLEECHPSPLYDDVMRTGIAV